MLQTQRHTVLATESTKPLQGNGAVMMVLGRSNPRSYRNSAERWPVPRRSHWRSQVGAGTELSSECGAVSPQPRMHCSALDQASEIAKRLGSGFALFLTGRWTSRELTMEFMELMEPIEPSVLEATMPGPLPVWQSVPPSYCNKQQG